MAILPVWTFPWSSPTSTPGLDSDGEPVRGFPSLLSWFNFPSLLSWFNFPSHLLSASHLPHSGGLAPFPSPLPYPTHTPVHAHVYTHTHTHTHAVVVSAMKRMCLCWFWPVACIPCCSELPSPAFHKRVPGLRKATGMSPPPCSGLASPFQSLRK